MENRLNVNEALLKATWPETHLVNALREQNEKLTQQLKRSHEIAIKMNESRQELVKINRLAVDKVMNP